MSKTILLAVDAAHPVEAAAQVTQNLGRDSGDRVVVLHVHEIAVGRFGRVQVCCLDGEGEHLVAATVDGLREAGVTADSEITEARYGHTARKILSVAGEHGARMIVLGSSNRTDLPHIPFGSVSHRLLHLAQRPVLIVPRQGVQPGRGEALTSQATAVG